MNVLKPSGFGRLGCMYSHAVPFLNLPLNNDPNPMNLCTRSHSRTFLATVLMGRRSGFVDWYGVLCSSWVSVSRGSTGRTYCNAEGNTELRSVKEGNVMAARNPGLENYSCARVARALKPSNRTFQRAEVRVLMSTCSCCWRQLDHRAAQIKLAIPSQPDDVALSLHEGQPPPSPNPP